MTNILQQAADAVHAGELIVFPTDTVFGIGCDPFNGQAVSNLFVVKKRPHEKSIPVLVDSIKTARAVGEISKQCEELLSKHWPGALTVVVKANVELPKELSSNGTVALRMPNHEDLLELITLAGGALATTSANISSKPPLTTYDEAYASFAEKVAMVLPGAVKGGVSSTVVDCTTDDFKILREGPITIE